ncbi:MAG TPA: glycosyltransferase [Anaerolineae bacterium]|nr:glycosyltransferase [Anaerolineae bacterium]
MSKCRVYLTGGDNVKWALDDDLRLTRRALQDMVEFTSLEEADVVHAMWWAALADIPKQALTGKRVICHVPGEPFRYFSLPQYNKTAGVVGQWIVWTRQAQEQLVSVGLESKLIPSTVNPEIFCPLAENDPSLSTFRHDLAMPQDSYLIGNFHRDTEGRDLKTPKFMKGPDIFVEIVRALVNRGHNVHILLAGPRRHWIRRRLAELGIPFTFVGELIETEDDISVNVLPQPTLNVLYNLLDLYVISSRTEGGPRSVMEAAASRCKLISTRVGLAPDILEPACIYLSAAEAVELIEKDIQSDDLQATIEPHQRRVLQNHQPGAVAPLFRMLYAHVDSIPPFSAEQRRYMSPTVDKKRPPAHIRALERLTRRSRGGELTVSIWHTFFEPPWGGGNQFMLALRRALQQRSITVRENQLRPDIDAYILNSIHFDIDRFLKSKPDERLPIVHRIDGPIHLIRGFDREKDELCFRLNAELASYTVLQSAWTYQRIVEMGYQPVNPVIIHNAVDPDIFHPRGRIPFDTERKIRLISTSWSDNPRKGGPIYRWIDERLDWQRFEYTFVGRASERFDRIRQVAPVPSHELADILRQHDIYIIASRNDPCSNALIEALACGLPVLYLNDGGHPELAGYGGLPFNEVDDVLPQLEALVEDYMMFQNLIVVPSLNDVADRYLALLREVAR